MDFAFWGTAIIAVIPWLWILLESTLRARLSFEQRLGGLLVGGIALVLVTLALIWSFRELHTPRGPVVPAGTGILFWVLCFQVWEGNQWARWSLIILLILVAALLLFVGVVTLLKDDVLGLLFFGYQLFRLARCGFWRGRVACAYG
jgi:hypothetical protein